MHPRNIFKQPPDYTELAIKYSDFRQVCRLELNGKVCLDYKNELALRALTQTLLLEYFKLKVDFAPGSLVPTLPLRLNYILWLEDILQPNIEKSIHGIDIGCGSSCIYSLLAAQKNKWHMLALESNNTNQEYALKNIQQNNLENLITLHKQQDKKQIFQEYFTYLETQCLNSPPYDFCLCNPPFFDSQNIEQHKSRKSGKRPPPHNCPTGYKEELSCEGGEVKFVTQIIEESLIIKNKIRIFTTMLGLKSSLLEILNILKSKNIENVCSTEFHQGNTTRWGVAWSFDTNMDLRNL